MTGSTFFGEGMESITILEDTNADGAGDTLIVTSGTLAEPTDAYLFENLDAISQFQFSDKQERYYTVNVTFKLESGMTAQIQIPSKGVKLTDTAKKVIELPIQSRSYQCVNPFCEGGDGKKPCSCSVVAGDEPDRPWEGIALLLAALVLAGSALRLRRRQHSL